MNDQVEWDGGGPCDLINRRAGQGRPPSCHGTPDPQHQNIWLPFNGNILLKHLPSFQRRSKICYQNIWVRFKGDLQYHQNIWVSSVVRYVRAKLHLSKLIKVWFICKQNMVLLNFIWSGKLFVQMSSFPWTVPSNNRSNEPQIKERFRKELAIYHFCRERKKSLWRQSLH